MKRFAIQVVIAILINNVAFGHAGDERKASARSLTTAERRATVLRILQQFRGTSRFPGAIAGVYFPDGSSIAVASGYANRDAKTPIKETDLLHAGSVGKTFFAALALQL